MVVQILLFGSWKQHRKTNVSIEISTNVETPNFSVIVHKNQLNLTGLVMPCKAMAHSPNFFRKVVYKLFETRP